MEALDFRVATVGQVDGFEDGRCHERHDTVGCACRSAFRSDDRWLRLCWCRVDSSNI